MALSTNTVWEVRTTGSDTNCSGGFVSGASGTDYSQQDTAQYTGADLVVDATTNTKVTSATHTFVSADVGNILRVTAGTSWTPGWYQIVSVASGAATLDRSPAATSTTGGSYCVGGSLGTIGLAVNSAMVGCNTVWVKGGPHTVSSALVPPGGTSGLAASVLRGYGTTRGDGVQATVTTSSAICVFQLSNQYVHLYDFDADLNSVGKNGIAGNSTTAGTSTYSIARNITIRRFTNYAFLLGGAGIYRRLWAVSGTSASPVAFSTNSDLVDCAASGCAGPGFEGAVLYLRCIAANNTGSSSDGFQRTYIVGVQLENCVAYKNGRDGLRLAYVLAADATVVRGSLFVQNGQSTTGYGINGSATGTVPEWSSDYNAFYGNTSGARNNVPAGPHDVTLSNDPFANAAGAASATTLNALFACFLPNATAGAGAAVRGAGYPSYSDIGAVQHADPVSGGVNIGMPF